MRINAQWYIVALLASLMALGCDSDSSSPSVEPEIDVIDPGPEGGEGEEGEEGEGEEGEEGEGEEGETPACGDGDCNGDEDSDSCPEDCEAPVCDLDGVCDPGENSGNCPLDCPAEKCGDGEDNDGDGDVDCDDSDCADECPEADCGDGVDNDGDGSADCDDSDCEDADECGPGPETCGNETCDAGESCVNCPADCGECPEPECGNDICEPGENAINCEADCGGGGAGELAECDAGNMAFAVRAIEMVLGRKPSGMREVKVLADMAEAIGREAVVLGLTESDEYLERFRIWFMDELRVNRVGVKGHSGCFDSPMQNAHDGSIAAFVRDNPATSKQNSFTFNMNDVLISSLVLDNMTPIYRTYLFAMMMQPIDGANVDQFAMDITRRQDFGEVFSAVYTNRDVVCAACHNSEFSTTDDPDPAQDRHWTVPGNLEKAIYGTSFGRAEMEVYSMFRHLDVVGGSTRPWSITSSCGSFTAQAFIDDDFAEYNAYFTKEQGGGNIWAVEEALYNGFNKLADGSLAVDPATLDVDPDEGFAYLVALRLVDRVWREANGYGLTLAHYFPRNETQRDILLELTNSFVASGFSMKSLLADVLTHPLSNQLAPESGCTTVEGSPYYMPNVFNPWVIAEDDASKRLNSVGDHLFRLDARVMLRSVEHALGYDAHTQFMGETSGAATFQKAIGAFIKDGEPGFDGVDFQGMLSWENGFGACPAPTGGGGGGGGGGGNGCEGSCGGQAPSGCFCDEACMNYGDCCDDYVDVCINGNTGGGGDGGGDVEVEGDWIGALVSAANDAGVETVTLRDLTVALKDRLTTRAAITDTDEETLIANLFDAESIDTPLADVDNWDGRIRNYCGVLLESPMFLLSGMTQLPTEEPPTLQVGPSYQDICSSYVNQFDLVGTVNCEEAGISISDATD